MTIEYIQLYDLLRARGISPGTLATAIEQVGIYGWDRYGRFKHFTKDSPEAVPAFNALAGHAQHDDPNTMAPIDHDDGTGVYSRYGWPADKLPDFADIEAGMPPAPTLPRPTQRSDEDATLAIVGALLDFIKGKVGEGREAHPAYESEAQLADLLAGELGEFRGLSKSNLQKKFTLAKRLIQSPPD